MKIKTKKARLIVKSIVCIVLSLAILIPATMFSLANDGKIYTSIKDLEGKVLSSDAKLKYYDFNKGLFTSKLVTGPDENGEYTVTIDTYTSNVTYLSAKTQTLDIMVLYDRSGSMGPIGSNTRWVKFKQGLTQTLQTLTDKYGVGSTRTANLAMIGFSTGVYNVLDYTEITDTSVKKDGEIYTLINSRLAAPSGGTNVGNGFEEAYKTISARMSSEKGKNNKQVVLLFTDGVPGFLSSIDAEDSDTPLTSTGEEQANLAMKYANKLKKAGVKIFSIGCGSMFEEDEKNTLSDGLAQWVVSGYRGNGNALKYRITNVFMNVVSSGWTVNAGNESREYTWSGTYAYDDNDDESQAEKYYKKYTNNELSKRAKYFKEWAGIRGENKAVSWQMMPKYYTLSEDVTTSQMRYYFSANDKDQIAAKLASAFAQALSTTVVSQGSLLGDYIVKDTVSSYFEIVPDSDETDTEVTNTEETNTEVSDNDETDTEPKKVRFYTVKYDKGYTNASVAKNNYGEEDRQWSDVTEITGDIAYKISEDKSCIEILAPVKDSTVIDTCVIDNVADSNNEKHSGNKLRITYKIRPKDSFMGGSSVPTHDYANSGIYKGNEVVQSFDKANSTDTNPVPKMSVELVRPTKITANSNVKIGFLYPAENVGNTDVNVTYQGRYSVNGAYNSYIMNADSGIVYDKDGAEISYGSYTVENDKDDNKSESSAARYFKRKELRR